MDDSEHGKSNGASESNEKSRRDSDGESEKHREEPKRASVHGHLDDEVFNEEEIQNLKDIFDLFDKDQSGKIEAGDLENILTSLKRDPEEAKQMLEEIDPNHDGEITFQEFIQLMSKIENKLDK